jgi:osmoprotectant transport system ATP-binding protein
MISVVGVSKSYGSTVVLAPTWLEVGEGERLAIVGPSGCGKSTLLRTIVGLVAPDRGTISIGGAALTPATAATVRLRIGYVIQEGGLFPHLTSAENVALLAGRRGWEATRIESRVEELARLVRVAPALLARYPLQLSGGERQRVGLMRALMLDPDVLLLDEPMGALDPLVRARLQDELLDVMNRLKKSVVLVTHDMYEAALFGHRLAVMRAGHIVQEGTLRDLAETPADPFVVEFLRAQRGMDRVAQ